MTSIGTNGAVYIAQNMYTGKPQATSVTSTLVYGVQWDAMCRYIGEAEYKATTPTKSAAELTGNVSTDEAKNIYDLAGNCCEWTMEANNTTDRVLRGAYYTSANAVSTRSNYTLSYDTGANLGFRLGLYVN